jgi:hypothetical protein
MGVLNSPRVLDWTPVLLRPSSDLHNVGQQSVGIRAVHTIQPLKRIQISQFVPVDRHVVPAPRFRHAVDRKANPLIYRYEEIKQHKRNDAGVDKRRRNNCHNPGVHDVAEKGSLQPSVLLLDFFGEPYLPVAQFVKTRFDIFLGRWVMEPLEP